MIYHYQVIRELLSMNNLIISDPHYYIKDTCPLSLEVTCPVSAS